jgi:hypothetical protein
MKLLKILAEVKNETTQIKEYITSDMLYVKDYFTMSPKKKMEYLPEEYYSFFDDFIIETDTDFEYPKVYDEEDGEESNRFEDSYDLVQWLRTNDRNVYEKFGKYLYDKIQYNEMPIPDQDYPAWTYFDDSVKLIKNQWLIHFTNDAEGIERSGFKYGVNDITKLGLTLHLGDFEKEYGGYNFAFTLDKFLKSRLRWSDEFKYGKEAVLFRASGIEAWHIGDEEYQVLFYGNTAKNIVAVTEGNEKRWGIRGKSGRVLFEDDDLDVVVTWFVKNYDQYRKQFPNS